MADTGTRSPTTTSGFNTGASSAIDGNDNTGASSFGIGGSKTYTLGGFAGDDLPVGATVNGVKVRIRCSHYILFSYEAATITSVKLSLNDGSAYSSNILSSNQNTSSSPTDYVFGGESETWGLDWSGFTDISDLKVEFISFTADGTGNHFLVTHEVDAIVYYTGGDGDSSSVFTPTMKIQSGFTLSGGKLTIK